LELPEHHVIPFLGEGLIAQDETVQGSNANVSHTINDDEHTEFTNHINGVRKVLDL
jgi:hypothetical protein